MATGGQTEFIVDDMWDDRGKVPKDVMLALAVNEVLNVFDLVIVVLLYGICLPTIACRCLVWTGSLAVEMIT